MIFICSKSGRLGNQLALLGHFIACAIENNLTIFNPAFEDYAKYFETTSNDILCRFPSKKFKISSEDIARRSLYLSMSYLEKVLRKINLYNYVGNFKVILARSNEERYLLNNQDFLELAKNKIVFCNGYFFRDYENVIKYSHEIKSYFTLNKNYQVNVDNYISKIREKSDIVVGIHIRQGDYKTYRNGQWFYETSEYVKILRNAEALFANQKVAFFVCSDTRQNESLFSEFNAFLSDKSLIEDLYLLSKCDYIIGPPSSFSRWASFYGNVPLYALEKVNQEVSLDKFEVNYQLSG